MATTHVIPKTCQWRCTLYVRIPKAVLSQQVKGKSNPCLGLCRPFWLQKIEAHRISVGKVISPTHRPPLPPRKYSWYSFCLRLCRTQGHSAAGRVMSMKNSIDSIGNRNRDLPHCLNQMCHRVPRQYFSKYWQCRKISSKPLGQNANFSDNLKKNFGTLLLWCGLEGSGRDPDEITCRHFDPVEVSHRHFPTKGNTPTFSNKGWDNHETVLSQESRRSNRDLHWTFLEYKPEIYPDIRRSWEDIIKNHVQEKW
jgi:hypothetical protein